MRILPSRLKGVLLIVPDVYKDSRGFFLESYHAQRYQTAGIPGVFVQDNHSQSVQGTLRGLHAQLQHSQGKLVRVIHGEIYDVAVDARPGSSTFKQWIGEKLTDENFHQLYIPPGFLHGFYVLSPVAEVEYKCTDYYDGKDEIGVVWNDPDLKIQWPVSSPQFLSEKDKNLPTLAELLPRLEPYRRFSPS